MTTVASPASRWSLAYRPLRPRGLVAQLVVLVLAEVVLFASYAGHEASFHWATHFLVGVAAAAIVDLALLALRGAPARGQLLSILAWHLYAMAPDLLFSAGIPHAAWMDVFLGHVSSHDVPGGTSFWLLVATACSAAYALVLSGWLAARTVEAAGGLAPAIGVGGAAVVRPQADPRLELLAHARFGPDGSPEVVLLHGLGASGEVWRPAAEALASRGVPVLVPDLLGFGRSRTSGTRFELTDHVEALAALLGADPGPPPVLVGHSFGCAVAVALAARRPSSARALVLVCPPVFRSGADARLRLGRRGWLARRVLAGSPLASMACGTMCAVRRPVGSLLVHTARDLPERVARDGAEHTWPAYRDALRVLLDDNPLPAAIAAPAVPTTVLLGDRDGQTPAADVLDWPHDQVEVVELADGDHLLPLRHPAAVADVILRAVAVEA